ncbi:MAG: hypothetical protein WD156_06305 [Acidimicrobiia bacterium]
MNELTPVGPSVVSGVELCESTQVSRIQQNPVGMFAGGWLTQRVAEHETCNDIERFLIFTIVIGVLFYVVEVEHCKHLETFGDID